MYLGQNLDISQTTVSQDPLSTMDTNIPGLTITAPEPIIGPIMSEPAPASSFPWLLVAVVAFLYFSSKR